jgi:hypothetical protein
MDITLDDNQQVKINLSGKNAQGVVKKLPAKPGITINNPAVVAVEQAEDGQSLVILAKEAGSAQVTVASPAPHPFSLNINVTVGAAITEVNAVADEPAEQVGK